MKLQTLIIDDEPIALEKLRSYVEKTPFLSLVDACNSPLEAATIAATEKVDLIFTDINMPDLNGIEFASSLPGDPMVVFITAYDSYAVESYRLSAVDYILKPYSFADFQRAANKALSLYKLKIPGSASEHRADSLFVKVDYRYINVKMSDIRYIKGYGEYLQIYTSDREQPLVTLSSFSAVSERLPASFVQVHRSYIVNMDQARGVERGRIIFDSDTHIPISDGYRDSFQAYLSSHSVGLKPRS